MDPGGQVDDLVFDDPVFQRNGGCAAAGRDEERFRRLRAELLVDLHLLIEGVLCILHAQIQLHTADPAIGVDLVKSVLRAVDEAGSH